MQAWVEREMIALDLGDQRLNRRCVKVLSALSDKPAMSIPAACDGWGETLAAYRFFDNPSVNTAAILSPHQSATIERMSSEPIVLVAQDTTTLNLTRPQQQVQGTGPLSDEKNHGLFDHVGLALTTGGVPLGVLFAHGWARDWEVFFSNKQLSSTFALFLKRLPANHANGRESNQFF